VPELPIGHLQPRTAQLFIGPKQEVEPEYLVLRFGKGLFADVTKVSRKSQIALGEDLRLIDR
jgi:hypothetical protein